MKGTITLFLKKVLIFSIPFLLLPFINAVTDPFDYFEYQPKIHIDRIHTVRRVNVADWTLSEISKIEQASKSNVNTVSIGDSRGRVLMSGGFEKGWKGRLYKSNQKYYDLSFGSAQLNESFSLLKKELKYLDSLKTIIIVLPIDRILTYKTHRNRIEESQFNSRKSIIKYLFNFRQLTYLLYPNSGKGYMLKGKDEEKQIEKLFLRFYNTTNRAAFDDNLSNIMDEIFKLKIKYNVKIIIPPYKKSFLKKILTTYKEDYNYYLNSLHKESIPVLNLQEYENDFRFVDPVHGFMREGVLNKMIEFPTKQYYKN